MLPIPPQRLLLYAAAAAAVILIGLRMQGAGAAGLVVVAGCARPFSAPPPAAKVHRIGVLFGNLPSLSNDIPTVRALAIDPSTPTTLYAGTERGVYKSTDGGDTWAGVNNGLARPGTKTYDRWHKAVREYYRGETPPHGAGSSECILHEEGQIRQRCGDEHVLRAGL